MTIDDLGLTIAGALIVNRQSKIVNHCRIAPNVTPRNKYWRKAKVTMTTGIKKPSEPAAIEPHSIPPRPIMVGMVGGAVRAFSLVSIRAKAYSFQEKISEKTVVAAMPPIT